jgi:hypothetical protein
MTNTDTVERLRELIENQSICMTPSGAIQRAVSNGFFTKWETVATLPALLDAVEALEPFAGYCTDGFTECSDFAPLDLKVRHFTAARLALAKLKGEG